MAGRKTLVDRVTEQISALPADRFITQDLTNALIDNSGKPITTNAAICGILKYYGLARNTGMRIRLGRNYYTVWEKNGATQVHSDRSGNEYGNIGVKA